MGVFLNTIISFSLIDYLFCLIFKKIKHLDVHVCCPCTYLYSRPWDNRWVRDRPDTTEAQSPVRMRQSRALRMGRHLMNLGSGRRRVLGSPWPCPEKAGASVGVRKSKCSCWGQRDNQESAWPTRKGKAFQAGGSWVCRGGERGRSCSAFLWWRH